MQSCFAQVLIQELNLMSGSNSRRSTIELDKRFYFDVVKQPHVSV